MSSVSKREFEIGQPVVLQAQLPQCVRHGLMAVQGVRVSLEAVLGLPQTLPYFGARQTRVVCSTECRVRSS